jgi:hypothetical protein
VAIVNVVEKQETELFKEASFKLFFPVVEGLFDLDEFDDRVDF